MPTDLLKNLEKICSELQLDEFAKKDFLSFISRISDERATWLWTFLQKNPNWLLKISNNIQAKKKILEQKDKKAWNEIIEKEKLDLLELKIEGTE